MNKNRNRNGSVLVGVLVVFTVAASVVFFYWNGNRERDCPTG